MSLAHYLVGAGFILNLCLAILVAVRGTWRPVIHAFLSLSLGISLWLGCIWTGLHQSSLAGLELWIRLSTASALFIPLFLFLFCETIISGLSFLQTAKRHFFWFAITLSGWILCGTHFFLKRVDFPPEAGDFVKVATPEYGSGFLIYVGWFLGACAITMTRGLLTRNSLRGIARTKLDYALLGVLVFNLLVVGTAGVAPIFFKDSQIIQLPALWVIVLDAILAYGISTRRLLELDSLSRRIAAYALWIIYLGAVYLLIRWIVLEASKLLGIGGELPSQIIPALAMILLMAQARSLSRTLVEKLFINEGRVSLKEGLRQIDNVCRDIGPLEDFAARSLITLCHIAGTDTGSIYFFKEEVGFQIGEAPLPSPEMQRELSQIDDALEQRAEPLISGLAARQAGTDPSLIQALAAQRCLVAARLHSGGKPVGIVLLGERLTGRIYDQEDIETIQLLLSHLSGTIASVRLFSEINRASVYQQTVLDQLITGVVATDARGKITVFNGEARRLMVPEETEAWQLPREVNEIIQGTLASGGEIRDREVVLAGRSDRLIPVRVSCRRFSGPDGKVFGSSLICQDLSRIKLLEQQIIQADRLASLGVVSANVAHEIKNPLVAIKTFSQLLPDRLDDKDFLKTFSTLIEGEVGRIDQIVSQLLVWARPKANRPEPLHLDEIGKSILTLYHLEFTKRRIRVESPVSPEPVVISGNRQSIQQVVVNVLLNAVEAMPAGGVLTIGARWVDRIEDLGTVACDYRRSPSERCGVMTVTDTGPGIPEGIFSRLFEPFFTSKPTGNGLGLSIVREIMQRHEGAIVIATRPGTAFHLAFTKM